MSYHYHWIDEHQASDVALQGLSKKYPEQYSYKSLDENILCYVKPGDDPKMQWHIALAQTSLPPLIRLFPVVLEHTGSKRLRLTLQIWYNHPQLHGLVDIFV